MFFPSANAALAESGHAENNGCGGAAPPPERAPYLEHSILFALDKEGETLLQLDVLPLTSKATVQSSSAPGAIPPSALSLSTTTSRAYPPLTTEWILLHMIPLTCSLSTMLARLVRLQQDMPDTDVCHTPEDKAVAATSDCRQGVSALCRDDGEYSGSMHPRHAPTAKEKNKCDGNGVSYASHSALPHTEHGEGQLGANAAVSYSSAGVHTVRVGYVVSEVQSYALLIGCRTSAYAQALRRALGTESAPGVVLPAVPVRALGAVMGREDVFCPKSALAVGAGDGVSEPASASASASTAAASSIGAKEGLRGEDVVESRTACVHLRHAITSHLARTTMSHASVMRSKNHTIHNSNNSSSSNNNYKNNQSNNKSNCNDDHAIDWHSSNRAHGGSVKLAARSSLTVLRAEHTTSEAALSQTDDCTSAAAVPLAVTSCLTRRGGMVDYASAVTLQEDNYCAICQVEWLSAKPCVITLCQHMFHLDCYARLPSTLADCPLCRFSLYDALSTARCAVCQTCEDLWVCLICGHVGCGRGRRNHQHHHFQSTGHSCALQTSTNRIFNNHTGMFVHQEVALSLDVRACAGTVEAQRTTTSLRRHSRRVSRRDGDGCYTQTKHAPHTQRTHTNNSNSSSSSSSSSDMGEDCDRRTSSKLPTSRHGVKGDSEEVQALNNKDKPSRNDALTQDANNHSNEGCSSTPLLSSSATAASATAQSVAKMPNNSVNRGNDSSGLSLTGLRGCSSASVSAAPTRACRQAMLRRTQTDAPPTRCAAKPADSLVRWRTRSGAADWTDDWWLRETDSSEEDGEEGVGGGSVELQAALMESLEDRVREHYFDLLQWLLEEQRAWFGATNPSASATQRPTPPLPPALPCIGSDDGHECGQTQGEPRVERGWGGLSMRRR